jgi:hypothetical protein
MPGNISTTDLKKRYTEICIRGKIKHLFGIENAKQVHAGFL